MSRADGLASIKAYEALFDDAETEEDDEEAPVRRQLDAKKNGKYKKKFCDKKKAQGKCDSKPRFMKKVCSKTCGFCEAAEGDEDEDEEEETKEVVAPPACENTPGKKKRKRASRCGATTSRRGTRQGGACPATAPSPRPLLRPPPAPAVASRAAPRAPALAGVQEEEDPQRMLRDVREKSDKWCANGECTVLTDSQTRPTVPLEPRVETQGGLKYLVPGVVARACKDDYVPRRGLLRPRG